MNKDDWRTVVAAAELLTLQREHATMLANLTATQKRCTEQEQRIRDQERELVELRGRQGAEELHDEPPRFEVLTDGDYYSAHDTMEQAEVMAEQKTRDIHEGEVTVVEVRTTYTVEPARDRTVTKKRLGPNYITED